MTSTCQTYKVFKAVIVRDAIYMMNNFCLYQWPSKMLRHYKNTFSDIASMVSIWMFWFLEKHISLCSCVLSIVPIDIKFSTKLMPRYVALWKAFVEGRSLDNGIASTCTYSFFHYITPFCNCTIQKPVRFVNKKNRICKKRWQ